MKPPRHQPMPAHPRHHMEFKHRLPRIRQQPLAESLQIRPLRMQKNRHRLRIERRLGHPIRHAKRPPRPEPRVQQRMRPRKPPRRILQPLRIQPLPQFHHREPHMPPLPRPLHHLLDREKISIHPRERHTHARARRGIRIGKRRLEHATKPLPGHPSPDLGQKIYSPPPPGVQPAIPIPPPRQPTGKTTQRFRARRKTHPHPTAPEFVATRNEFRRRVVWPRRLSSNFQIPRLSCMVPGIVPALGRRRVRLAPDLSKKSPACGRIFFNSARGGAC
jgi:hypothetical protein